ncbi:hypothetical protein [Streptomyces violascens]|uniref:hypothetical protein n=1 Tax=Streptomyces violascens TaxID=67381 RepID=UPI001CFD8B3D|nr:hypothetical protein [Streptomyces violascens]
MGRVLSDHSGKRLLFGTAQGRYLAVRSSWNQRISPQTSAPPSVRLTAPGELADDPLHHAHLRHGGPESFSVDLQGIDAFLFARAKYFQDATARQAVIALGMVKPDVRYLRVGAAGAPPAGGHPGGEVLEHSLLDGPHLSGESFTASGYLPPGRAFSVATPLTLPTSPDLLERRSVYSHTAFLPQTDGPAPGGHLLRLEGSPDGLNALDALKEFVSANRIDSYAVRIFVRVTDPDRPPRIIGRVLRRIPHRRLTHVQQATDIASEQEFPLLPSQELHCYGTYWPRRSVDWEKLRGGKPYEPRGHIHMEVRGQSTGPRQHAISHLRELFVTPGTECLALIDPIHDVVRIEPVVQRGRNLVSRCSGRPVVDDFSSKSWSSIS